MRSDLKWPVHSGEIDKVALRERSEHVGPRTDLARIKVVKPRCNFTSSRAAEQILPRQLSRRKKLRQFEI